MNAPRHDFNPHQSKTVEGVVITKGLAVYTNDLEPGTVEHDRDGYSGRCCHVEHPEHTAAQTRDGFTDHEAGNAAAKAGCWCRHDHWFDVKTAKGTTMVNGERMSTRGMPGMPTAEKALADAAG